MLAALKWAPLRWRCLAGSIIGHIGYGVLDAPGCTHPRSHRSPATRSPARGEHGKSTAIAEAAGVARPSGSRDRLPERKPRPSRGRTAVYLVGSKLLEDEVWIDDAGLHVRRLGESATRDAREAKEADETARAEWSGQVTSVPGVSICGHTCSDGFTIAELERLFAATGRARSGSAISTPGRSATGYSSRCSDQGLQIPTTGRSLIADR
jgi:hypothetical protein